MKAVILTGSSGGLGKAIFDILCQDEVYLISIARRFLPDQEKLAKERNDHIGLIRCDLSKSNAFHELKNSLSLLSDNNEISEIFFINNAAVIEPLGLIGGLESDAIIDAVNVNFLFPVLLTNYLFSIREKRKVKIVNISTGAANKGIVGWPLYCSGKAGTKMFFEVLRLQEAEDQVISVIDYDPGIMDTQMQQTIRNAGINEFPMVERFTDFQKNGKLSKPEAVARFIIKSYLR